MTEAEGTQARIDRLMAEKKGLVGGDGWHPGPLPGSVRWTSGLTDSDGAISNLRLVMDSYPAFGFDKVVLQVVAAERQTSSVMRLCFGADSRHHNRHWRKHRIAPGVVLGWIFGPHIHRWQENRHLASDRSLPEELLFAIPLPSKIKTFEAAFWHFCDEANIVCPSHLMPLPPPPDRLV